MKIKNARSTFLNLVCATILVGLSSSSQPVRAEGDQNFTGAQGVNRVIRSTSGNYLTTGGTASMNFINVPAKGGKYNDKPSFYLGSTIGLDEVDAGIQYESDEVDGYDPGWSAFISISRNGARAVYASPQVVRSSDNQSIAWRGGAAPTPGKPISSSISSSVVYETHANGTVSVTIGALKSGGRVAILTNSGTFFHNATSSGTTANTTHHIAPWYGADPLTGDQNATTIKRVTAMTRGSGDAENDGSQLTGTWSGAFGAPIDHGENRTGYDAPGNGQTGQRDGQGGYKVNFPNLNVSEGVARTDVAASRAATQSGVSRYNTESVSINLRNPRPRGRGRK